MSRLRPIVPITATAVIVAAVAVALAGSAPAQQQQPRNQRPAPAAPTVLAGNAERGAEIYENRCTGCHSLDANRVGPAHRGVVGRRVGTARGFEYSDALRGATLVWTEALIQRWLTNPEALIPGQQMGFRLGDAQERADVAAFLARESQRPPAP
jgi:cytochrome c